MKNIALILVLISVLITASIAAQEDEIVLVPFSDEGFQVEGLIPENWTTAGPGIYLRPGLPTEPAVLLIQSAPMAVEALGSLVAAQLSLDALPESSGTRSTAALDWTLYEAEVSAPGLGAVAVLFAFAEQESTSYVVLFQSKPDEIEALRESVYHPVLDALKPITLELNAPYFDLDGFTEQEMVFGIEGWELPGTLTLPVGEGPFPAVVLVHGSGPNNRDEALGPNKLFRDLAWGLAAEGIAVLRYDKRTLVYQQDEKIAALNSLDMETVDDAVAAAAFLREQDQVDAEKVFIVGHSQGALAAPRIGERDPQLAGLIMLAGPARFFEDVIFEQVEYLSSLGNAQAVEGLGQIAEKIAALRAGEAASEAFFNENERLYWLSFIEYDQVAVAQNLSMPMLILQGERDYQATMEDFALWQEALSGRENVTFKSYPALNHMFSETGEVGTLATQAEYLTQAFTAEEVIDDIAAWVLAR